MTAVQVGLVADWVASNPEMPASRGYKWLAALKFSVKGDSIKTFIPHGLVPAGEEL
jgi:hypothetical protein